MTQLVCHTIKMDEDLPRKEKSRVNETDLNARSSNDKSILAHSFHDNELFDIRHMFGINLVYCNKIH